MPLSISRGRENRAIKFISSLLIPYFLKKERGLTSGVCRGRGTTVHMEKKEARSDAVKVFHLLPQVIRQSASMCLSEWRVE